ncbi:MAG TPA: YicC/YloC family endoribonuclease, partial [Burkholderiales bacterium]|nr:YicC/YloC family endoribonuclease [Burkholderiales bacterium]
MTGYAAVAVDAPRGRLSLELRSVNGRFLDLQFRIAEELRIHEPLLREVLSARLARGKVECRLQFAPGTAGMPRGALNAEALAELARLAGEVKKAVPDAAPLRVADILRWPGVMSDDAPSESEMRERIEQLAAQGIDELVAARAREGARLAEAIRSRVAEMHERVTEAAPLV